MPFERVKPDDMAQVTAAATIDEAARRVDDPDDFPPIPEILAGDLRYGWDLEPEERYLYTPADAADPVGALALDMPPPNALAVVIRSGTTSSCSQANIAPVRPRPV